MCAQKELTQSSSTASGQHAALDLISTLACKNPLWKNKAYHSAPLKNPFDRQKSEPGAQKSHRSPNESVTGDTSNLVFPLKL